LPVLYWGSCLFLLDCCSLLSVVGIKNIFSNSHIDVSVNFVTSFVEQKSLILWNQIHILGLTFYSSRVKGFIKVIFLWQQQGIEKCFLIVLCQTTNTIPRAEYESLLMALGISITMSNFHRPKWRMEFACGMHAKEFSYLSGDGLMKK
jgi:hypothetical protein